jgi:hypothetical protein
LLFKTKEKPIIDPESNSGIVIGSQTESPQLPKYKVGDSVVVFVDGKEREGTVLLERVVEGVKLYDIKGEDFIGCFPELSIVLKFKRPFEKVEKPELTISRRVFEEIKLKERIDYIIEAMQKCATDGKEIPQEWRDELGDLYQQQYLLACHS